MNKTLILLSTILILGQVAIAQIDTKYYYRLTTLFQGDNKALDIINDASDDKPILATKGAFTGQFWRFILEDG